MEALARRVQHQLRMALSDWYAWLVRRSQRESDWLETPWWSKRLPGQLDLPWALHSLTDYLDNPAMLKILYIRVDEAHLASKDLDGVPNMSKLVEIVNELYEASRHG